MSEDSAAFNRVYDKMDGICRDVAEIKTSLAELKAGMPPRPCTDLVLLQDRFEAHINEHEKNSERWWQLALRMITPSGIAAGVAAAVAYFVGKH